MYEFLRLILTGTREQRLKRFNNVLIVLAICEMVLAVSLLFVSKNVHVSVPTVLGILLTVLGVINTVLTIKRSSLTNSLIAEQLQSDGLADDELSSARKSLAEKYLTAFSKQKGIYFAVLNCPLLIYILSAVFAVLSNVGNNRLSTAVPILFAIGTVTGIVIAVIAASLDSGSRTDLYEQANSEIKTIKRYAGINENEIAKQAYNARNSYTRSLELFLVDPKDKRELRKISNVTSIFGVAVLIVYIILIYMIPLVAGDADSTYLTVGASCITGTLFIVWACAIIWAEIRRRAIYKRNEAKLANNETDNMRRYLQNEFKKLQKVGNLFFSLFCGIATLIGFILGLTSAINDPEISLAQNILGVSTVFFIVSAIIALLVWIIVYAVYRRKVKSVELQLSNIPEQF